MNTSWKNDLQAAAKFIRSVQTDCPSINLDLDDIAAALERTAAEIGRRSYVGTCLPSAVADLQRARARV